MLSGCTDRLKSIDKNELYEVLWTRQVLDEFLKTIDDVTTIDAVDVFSNARATV